MTDTMELVRKRQRTSDDMTATSGGSSLPNGSSSTITTQQPVDGEKFYFDSYAQLGIHEAMLRDTVRTEAYYNAIMHHRHLFRDKTVIDVGCGTGILSLFCAWAGAKRVYAIEASGMAAQAEKVVAENNQSHVISIVHGKVEDIELIDEAGNMVVADVIVSEWMGYFLFYESMLESVLLARDRWLSKTGAMFPSHAVLYLCPVTDDQYYGDRIFFWTSVYGAKMSCLYDHARHCSFDNVIIDTAHPFQCFAAPEVIKFIDCKTCSIEEVQTWKAKMTFRSMIVTNFHGFLGYFTVLFAPEPFPKGTVEPSALSATDEDGTDVALTPHSKRLLERLKRHDPTLQSLSSLTTSPEHPTTHWQHTFFFTGDQRLVVQDQEIETQIDVSQNNENKRFLDITIHWSVKPPPQGSPQFCNPQNPTSICPPPPPPPYASPAPATISPSPRPYRNPYATSPTGTVAPSIRNPHPMAVNTTPRHTPISGYAVDYGYGGYGHGFGYNPGQTCGGYHGASGAPGVGGEGSLPTFPQPDTDNQYIADNPPQNAEYECSKTFGFK